MRKALGFLVILFVVAACRYEAPPDSGRASSSGSNAGREEAIPLRLGEGITAPTVVKRVRPDFAECDGEELSGRPVLEVVVDETGSVRHAHMLTPVTPCMERVILSSVRQSRFRPAVMNGRPVAVVFNITVLVEKR
ncbi:MAG: hypothetical protein WC538_22960 [Thermoanaerobaculia bacterium]